MTNWAHDACGLVARSPDQYDYIGSITAHSMRVGCASAMNAAGLSRETIRLWLGWKTQPMLDVYIRPVTPTPHNATLICWMNQRPPTALPALLPPPAVDEADDDASSNVGWSHFTIA